MDAWGDPLGCAFAGELLWVSFEDGSLRALDAGAGYQVACVFLPEGYHGSQLWAVEGRLVVQDARNTLWAYEQGFEELSRSEGKGREFLACSSRDGRLRLWRGLVGKDLAYSGRY